MNDFVEATGESAEALSEALMDADARTADEIIQQSRNLGLAFGAFVVGAGLGAVAGYIFAQRRLEKVYNEIAAAEIAEVQAHYHAKDVARENAQEKGELESIVRNRGYVPDEEPEVSTAPPMVVTPPSAVVERAEEVRDEEAETPPPPEQDLEPEVRNIFRDNEPMEEDEWDWHKERSQRSPLRPYVIHVDERHDHEAYDAVTFTYYEQDDVVCNERDEVLSAEERERIIDETNLEKFGHGSGDPTTVYVRNDQLEMDIEVIRSPNSYAEEVHGFEPEIKHSNRRRGRASFDD